MLITIMAFLFVFTIITIVHEAGHLYFSKKSGIRVHEFGIGFGPTLFSKEINNTSYKLNLLPILGYVKIAGIDTEDPKETATPEAEKYYQKRPLIKFISIFSGPFMNLIFGFLIFSTLFLITGIPVGVTNEIATVSPGSVASQIGLMPGDQLIAINGKAYNSPEKAIDFIHKSSGKELTLNILRNNKTILTKAIPEYNKRLKMGLIGFSLKAAYKKANIFAAVYTGLQQTIGLSVLTLFLLGKLFIGQLALNDLAGPIGIAQITGQYAHSGLVSFFNFMGFFSINVAIVNLLPIPALDGGRLFFVLLEAIRRKPISIETENKIHYIGLLFLLGLLAILTFNDLTRIFHD